MPKLAKGGIVNKNAFILGDYDREYVTPLRPYQKRLNIYHKTKNRRIKKKQEKLCPLIKVSNEIIKYVGLGNNHKKFKVYINGKEVEK